MGTHKELMTRRPINIPILSNYLFDKFKKLKNTALNYKKFGQLVLLSNKIMQQHFFTLLIDS